MNIKKKKVVILLSILILLIVSFTVFAHTFVFNVFSGRVHFPDKYIGEHLTMEDGKKFLVFRRLKISEKNNITDGLAVFKVRFKFKSLSLGVNKRLSMIPAPFLIGMKGFREKYWTINEDTGTFQGIYQWESKEFANNYPNSFIFKLMTKRSAEGTLSHEIIPDTDLQKYVEELSSVLPR